MRSSAERAWKEKLNKSQVRKLVVYNFIGMGWLGKSTVQSDAQFIFHKVRQSQQPSSATCAQDMGPMRGIASEGFQIPKVPDRL